MRLRLIRMAGVGNRGYSVWEAADRCFQDAAGTKSLWCIGKYFRAAIATNSDYSNHGRKVACALPLLYLVNFRHTLCRHEFHEHTLINPQELRHEFHEFTRMFREFGQAS